jgi:hypothetical protein
VFEPGLLQLLLLGIQESAEWVGGYHFASGSTVHDAGVPGTTRGHGRDRARHFGDVIGVEEPAQRKDAREFILVAGEKALQHGGIAEVAGGYPHATRHDDLGLGIEEGPVSSLAVHADGGQRLWVGRVRRDNVQDVGDVNRTVQERQSLGVRDIPNSHEAIGTAHGDITGGKPGDTGTNRRRRFSLEDGRMDLN